MDDVRSPATDPFTPGYGVVPQVFAGRQAEFADFEGVVLRRVAAGTYEPARLLTGDRGMGKTALLKQFEAEAEEAGHWVARVSAVRGDAVLADLVEAIVDVLDGVGVAVRLPRAAKQALSKTAVHDTPPVILTFTVRVNCAVGDNAFIQVTLPGLTRITCDACVNAA